VIPLQAERYTAPGVTPAERIAAVGVLLLLALIVAGLLWRGKYLGLSTRYREQKAAVQAAVANATLHRTRFRSGDALAKGADRLRDTIHGEIEAPPSTRTAARTVGAEILASTIPRWRTLPPLARRLGALAVGAAVFGAIAVSTAAVVELLRADGGEPGPIDLLSIALSESAAFVGAVRSGLVSQPGVYAAWELLVTGLLIGGEWLYQRWYLLAAALAAGAVVTYTLDRIAGAPRQSVVRSRLWAGVQVTGVVVAAWLLGIGLFRTLGRVFAPEIAALVALGSAVLLLAAGAVVGLQRVVAGVRTTLGATDAHPVLAAIYVLARPLWALLAAVAVPVVLAYLIVAATRAPRVWAALLAAPWYVRAAAVAIAIFVAVVVTLATRDAWPTARRAVGDLLSRTSLRTKLLLWGVPALGTVLTTLFAYSVVRSWPIAIAVAIVLGAIAGVVAKYLRIIRYRATFSTPDRPRSAAVVEAGILKVEGETHYYARLNGTHELLAPTVEYLIADIQTAGGGLFDDGAVTPTPAAAYYDAATQAGILEYEDSARKLLEQCRKALYDQGYRHGAIEKEDLLNRMTAKYPDSVVRLRLQLAKQRWNVIERRRDGEQVVEFLNFPNRA